jgi:transcriptional regulator with XRE-family HTH domain
MMTIDEIRTALQDRRLTVIAAQTGLHYNTISAIKRGEQINPQYDTMIKLSTYLTHGLTHGTNIISEYNNKQAGASHG